MLIDSVLSNPRSLESIGRRGQFPPTKQCEVCALEMSDLPNRGRTVCISPCVLLMVVISLIEIGGCSGDGASPTPHGGRSACRRRPSSRPASAEAPDLSPRLIRSPGRGRGRPAQAASSREPRSTAPSALPNSPTTLRPSLQTPAMPSTDPFGLST